jgi:hypothetical protein
MPATVRGVNVFCPSQGLTGLSSGYNREGTLGASRDESVPPDAAIEEPETSDNVMLPSDSEVSGAVWSRSKILSILC